jgi:hypothetical protein
MKLIRCLAPVLALVAGLFTASAAFAHEGHHKTAGELVAIDAKTDAAWLEKAKAEYPTDICVVSEDKLGGDMGKPRDYTYRVEGKPDRLVRFCCKDCVKDFNKDPDKYLKLIDEAAATKKAKG